ncbi:MAG: NAD(P)H-dependent oxidoreductase subunit E [Deltaproteobacteria bacterium]|nr:NAD(P)H-dependent oxidoreductase subunit E [Deltaproteobacteria bacterium]
MNLKVDQVVKKLTAASGRDRTRMMDVVRGVQAELGCVSGEAMEAIARELGCERVEVEGVVSFYAFLSKQPKGKAVIRISDCVVCRMKGADKVTEAFEQALGIRVGETTADGQIGLERTACIGLCDQGPAALVNDVPVTYLSTEKVSEIVDSLTATGEPKKLVKTLGEGKNATERIHSMVINNVRKKGEVIFAGMEPGAALRKAAGMSPQEVIREVKTARLRGRGGAGFPAGMKWEFCRKAAGERKFVICNADEGEPGTFKDRVILTECPELLIEGMAIAGYAIGAEQGIIYLRGEYDYLRAHLEFSMAQMHEKGLLGDGIAGKKGFAFDIRIQMGAGAYVCGEESALIQSCEGQRGSPRDRPPFPVEVGYLNMPTVVNNVETFCCAARIVEKGAGWFAELGSKDSTGTKLFSVSGDCSLPGVYELPFGLTISEFLETVGGRDAIAVQVGGPSGTCVNPEMFDRRICFEDLGTGGSMIVFGPQRSLLDAASQFMDFFVEESCGWCVPCRVGNVLIKERLDRIRQGKGQAEDLDYLEQLCETVKRCSRCGLGQTSPNPVQTTLKHFREHYTQRLVESKDGLQPTFDLTAALGDAVEAQGREPVFHED